MRPARVGLVFEAGHVTALFDLASFMFIKRHALWVRLHSWRCDPSSELSRACLALGVPYAGLRNNGLGFRV